METDLSGLLDRLSEPLETFLVEWKRGWAVGESKAADFLETFLVEWKREELLFSNIAFCALKPS